MFWLFDYEDLSSLATLNLLSLYAFGEIIDNYLFSFRNSIFK